MFAPRTASQWPHVKMLLVFRSSRPIPFPLRSCPAPNHTPALIAQDRIPDVFLEITIHRPYPPWLARTAWMGTGTKPAACRALAPGATCGRTAGQCRKHAAHTLVRCAGPATQAVARSLVTMGHPLRRQYIKITPRRLGRLSAGAHWPHGRSSPSEAMHGADGTNRRSPTFRFVRPVR